MTTLITRLDIHAENGDRETNYIITLELDGSQPDCPIKFIVDGKAVFSLASHEVDVFVTHLQSLVP